MSVLEYSLLVAGIFAALLASQVMLRRAISYKWKEAADNVGFGRQYQPYGSKATVIINHN